MIFKKKEVKKKVCCVCGKSLKYPIEVTDGKFDGVARVCVRCGNDICVFCLQKLPKAKDEFGNVCPVCKKSGIFELSGKPDWQMKSLEESSRRLYGD
jgi:hypothetical protein